MIEFGHDDRTGWQGTNIEMKLAVALEMALEGLSLTCACCGEDLHDAPHVDLYDHHGGNFLIEDWPKQWISLHCDKCGHDTSYNKLRRIVAKCVRCGGIVTDVNGYKGCDVCGTQH